MLELSTITTSLPVCGFCSSRSCQFKKSWGFLRRSRSRHSTQCVFWHFFPGELIRQQYYCWHVLLCLYFWLQHYSHFHNAWLIHIICISRNFRCTNMLTISQDIPSTGASTLRGTRAVCSSQWCQMIILVVYSGYRRAREIRKMKSWYLGMRKCILNIPKYQHKQAQAQERLFTVL